MTLVADFAQMIERFCDDEYIVEEPGGPVAYGIRIDHDMFMVLTPTCSVVERERVLAELPPWAQRQIQQSIDDANAVTDRVTNAARRRPHGQRRTRGRS